MDRQVERLSAVQEKTPLEARVSRKNKPTFVYKRKSKMDYGEFLWMSSGAVIVGVGIYMLITILS